MTKSGGSRSARIAVALVAAGGMACVPATAFAEPAVAAYTCKTVRGTVSNSQGLAGGHVQARLCVQSSSPGNAYIDDDYYNFVEDYQADGVAARAYVTWSGGLNGPLATDDTSTSGGQFLDRWESTYPGTSFRVRVCLGKKYPGESGARCATAS